MPGELQQLLRRQDAVAARRQLTTLITDDSLDHLIARRHWQRAGWGVIVAHNGPLTAEQRLWAACLCAGQDAVLGGITAAVAGGLRPPGDEFLGEFGGEAGRNRIHLLVPATRQVRERHLGAAFGATVVVHRTSALTPPDIHPAQDDGPPRTTMARSIVDAAAWAVDDRQARRIVLAATSQRVTTIAALRDMLVRLPRTRRRALVRDALKEAARAARG